ncbi:MAG: GNAT family N-acetyltransferase [Chloroflexota bacterium]
MFKIRSYHPSDCVDLYRICLETGDNGRDATPLYLDPDLPGHYWAASYAYLEPELCFILTRDERPVGYVLGTQDTARFSKRCEVEWFPPLRARYALQTVPDRPELSEKKDRNVIQLILQGYHASIPAPGYPAHLHIDILPAGQGYGFGRKLIETFCAALRERRVPGVFLGVGRENKHAIGFYRHIGFEVLEDASWGYQLGLRLD